VLRVNDVERGETSVVFDEDGTGGENSEEQQSSILFDVEAMFEENLKGIIFEMNSCNEKI
jgi:hypothetical protein